MMELCGSLNRTVEHISVHLSPGVDVHSMMYAARKLRVRSPEILVSVCNSPNNCAQCLISHDLLLSKMSVAPAASSLMLLQLHRQCGTWNELLECDVSFEKT